jgi:hypothetical protein
VRPIVADTASIGYTHVTGGSRVTFATGMAVVDTTKKIIQELCIRAAKMWDVDPEGVVWEDGCARPASSNVGDFKPLSLKEIAAKRAQTGGPIVAAAAVNPRRGGARLRHPVLRCRGRSGDRQGEDFAFCRRSGRRTRHPPELCRGADPRRRDPRHRLGARDEFQCTNPDVQMLSDHLDRLVWELSPNLGDERGQGQRLELAI